MDSFVVQERLAAATEPSPSSHHPAKLPDGGVPASVVSPRITVVMPTTDYAEPFGRCARRVLESLQPAHGDELIVVFDGQAPAPPAWLADSGARLVATQRRAGPAAARNLAAKSARGDVLLFVDADVELAPDAVDRVRAAFAADPDLCGVFGAYDSAPTAPGLVSRFRNLLHHHTHVSHAGPAETFWSGCGAMRTGRFLDLGGFDTRFRQPSIEDIELGSRAVAAGGRVRLDPGIGCTHHKRWTLRSMIVTDIRQRAIPWTRLMLATGHVPRRLNVDGRSRASGLCAVLAAGATLLAPFQPWALVAALACLAALFLLNRGFYSLCRSTGGLAFAAGAFLLHWLYFTYATLAFAAVVVDHRVRGPSPAPRGAALVAEDPAAGADRRA